MTTVTTIANEVPGDLKWACRLCLPTTGERLDIEGVGGYTLASYGAFVPGWLLVVPREHVPSTGALNESQWEEFEDVIDQARQRISTTSSNTIAFEHGAAGFDRAAGCGVEHAHVHLVPIQLDIRKAVDALGGEFAGYDWAPCEGRPKQVTGKDYIWISDSTGSWVHYSTSQPSQVVRRAIALTLGVREWDWKKNHRIDTVRATLRMLTPAS